MEFNFKRNPAAVLPTLFQTGDQLRTKTGCEIYVPVRYAERDLAVVGKETSIIGLFPLVVGENYSLCSICAMVPIRPAGTTVVSINDEDYYKFTFEKNSVVIENLNLVKKDTLTYVEWNEFFSKGHLPVGVLYDDILKLFRTAQKHAGTTVAKNYPIMELLASRIARNPENPREPYRLCVTTKKQVLEKPPRIVGLRNVSLSSSGTLNKVAGSYLGSGMVAAMVDPSERPSKIENALRS